MQGFVESRLGLGLVLFRLAGFLQGLEFFDQLLCVLEFFRQRQQGLFFCRPYGHCLCQLSSQRQHGRELLGCAELGNDEFLKQCRRRQPNMAGFHPRGEIDSLDRKSVV